MPGRDMPRELKCAEDEERRDGHDQDAPLADEDPHHEGKSGTDQDWRDAVPQVIEGPRRVEIELTAEGDKSPVDREGRRGQDLESCSAAHATKGTALRFSATRPDV